MPDVDPKCPKCQSTLAVKLTEVEFYTDGTDHTQGRRIPKVGAIIVSCANCGHIIGCVSTTGG